MTGPAPGRLRASGPLSRGRQDELPARPSLTTPARLQRKALADVQRQNLQAQPWLGVGGMLLAAVVFFALALGTGSTERSLLILGPISTFALPAVAMIAFWWNDWPGSSLTTPWTGLIDTVLVVIAAVGLTITGQAVVERSDLRGVFEASPGPGVPTTFPATLALAGAAFTVMLQLSLVCERWPLAGLGRLRSGVAALVLSWAAGAGAYFLFVNLDAVPSAERAAAGLRNPGGPVPAADFGAALIAVGVWQAVLFIALRGWPVNTIDSRLRRLLAGNALVIGLGALTYLVLRNLAGWQPGAIGAVCGCIISAALIVAMLFEGWPAARLAPAPGRALTVALTALVALALNRALAAYASSVHWAKGTPDDWVTTAALSFLGAGIILHVGIGLRWPFAARAKALVAASEDAQEEQEDVERVEEDRRGDQRRRDVSARPSQPLEIPHGQPGEDHQSDDRVDQVGAGNLGKDQDYAEDDQADQCKERDSPDRGQVSPGRVAVGAESGHEQRGRPGSPPDRRRTAA